MNAVQATGHTDLPLAAKILLMEDTIHCSVESMTGSGAVVVVPSRAGVPNGFFLETVPDGVRRFVSVAARNHAAGRAEIHVEFRTEPFRVWA